jgi:hypothetical protein
MSFRHLWFAIGISLLWLPAYSESLNCNGGFVDIGNSMLSVVHKCGQPALKNVNYVPVEYYPAYQAGSFAPFPGTAVRYETVEEWLYDRGPGNFVATVRFRSGIVELIRYGRGL